MVLPTLLYISPDSSYEDKRKLRVIILVTIEIEHLICIQSGQQLQKKSIITLELNGPPSQGTRPYKSAVYRLGYINSEAIERTVLLAHLYPKCIS